MIRFRVLAALLVLAATIMVLGSRGFRVNLTASLPLGVYRVTSRPASRGSIVNVCLPSDVADFARQRAYLGPGSCPGGVRPVGKIVIAAEGDIVALDRDGIRVNGEIILNSKTLVEDSRGRGLPHYPWGEHRMQCGELWLFSPYHRNAYDSRYFGPVLNAEVGAVLRPLWTTARRTDPVMIGLRPSDASAQETLETASGRDGQKEPRGCAR